VHFHNLQRSICVLLLDSKCNSTQGPWTTTSTPSNPNSNKEPNQRTHNKPDKSSNSSKCCTNQFPNTGSVKGSYCESYLSADSCTNCDTDRSSDLVSNIRTDRSSYSISHTSSNCFPNIFPYTHTNHSSNCNAVFCADTCAYIKPNFHSYIYTNRCSNTHSNRNPHIIPNFRTYSNAYKHSYTSTDHGSNTAAN
jgi:hypothetical protein